MDQVLPNDSKLYKSVNLILSMWVKSSELKASVESLEDKGVSMADAIKNEGAEAAAGLVIMRRGALDSVVTECTKSFEEGEYAKAVAHASHKIEQLKGEQNAVTNAYQAALKAKFDEAIVLAVGTLQEIAGGLLEGKSWKDKLAADADFSACLAQARSSVFKQKGIKGQILKGIADLHESFRLPSDYPSAKFVPTKEQHIDKDEAIARAHITMAEATILQLCSSVTGQGNKAVRTKLDTEVQTLAKLSIASSSMHASIWGKMQEVSGTTK